MPDYQRAIPGYLNFQKYPNGETVATLSRPRASIPRASDRDPRELVMPEVSTPAGGISAPLVIVNESSQPGKKRRKIGSIGKRAQRKIRRLSGLFRPENKDRQVFLTGTLPGSTDSAVQAFADYSSYAIKILCTYVPRNLGVQSSQIRYLWCWELQRRGALHIHLVVELESREKAKELVKLWRRIWSDVLVSVARKSGVDIFARASGGTWASFPSKWRIDGQLVKKNAARYLSKYLSKGSGAAVGPLPSRWYGASSQLRADFGDFVTSNAISLPFTINRTITRNLAIGSLKSSMADLLGGFCTDVSQWAQDSVYRVFGFSPDGLNLLDLAESVVKALNPILESARVAVPRIIPSPSRGPFFDLFNKVISVAPARFYWGLTDFFLSRGLSIPMSEYYSSQLGILDFCADSAFLCREYRAEPGAEPLWGDVIMGLINTNCCTLA